MSDSTPESDTDFPSWLLHLHRAEFSAALASGTTKPFVVPWSVSGAFFLPVLYLCVPHRKRLWLYQLRWVVAGLMALLNCDVLISGTRSGNHAIGYAIGLVCFRILRRNTQSGADNRSTRLDRWLGNDMGDGTGGVYEGAIRSVQGAVEAEDEN